MTIWISQVIRDWPLTPLQLARLSTLVQAGTINRNTAKGLIPRLRGTDHVTIDQPGWREARKIAGRGYAQVTAPVGELDDPAALCSAALYGSENVVRVLDSLVAALQSIRHDIQQGQRDTLTERMQRWIDSGFALATLPQHPESVPINVLVRVERRSELVLDYGAWLHTTRSMTSASG